MKFLKKVTEFSKLAQAFNGYYPFLNETKSNSEATVDDLFILAWLGRKEIIDRMEEYKWNLNSKIKVPSFPSNDATLGQLFNLTIGELVVLSEENDCVNEITEILDRGELFYSLESRIPKYIKGMIT